MDSDDTSTVGEGRLSDTDLLTDEEWMAEISRRVEKALAGEPGIPWEQVESDVRQRLKSIRQNMDSH
jgi:hypothetical protein